MERKVLAKDSSVIVSDLDFEMRWEIGFESIPCTLMSLLFHF